MLRIVEVIIGYLDIYIFTRTREYSRGCPPAGPLEGTWTLSDSGSDLSAPPPLVSSATFEPTLRKLNIPDDPRWAKKLHYKMRRKDVVQSRALRVESALSGTLPEYDIFQATN